MIHALCKVRLHNLLNITQAAGAEQGPDPDGDLVSVPSVFQLLLFRCCQPNSQLPAWAVLCLCAFSSQWSPIKTGSKCPTQSSPQVLTDAGMCVSTQAPSPLDGGVTQRYIVYTGPQRSSELNSQVPQVTPCFIIYPVWPLSFPCLMSPLPYQCFLGSLSTQTTWTWILVLGSGPGRTSQRPVGNFI